MHYENYIIFFRDNKEIVNTLNDIHNDNKIYDNYYNFFEVEEYIAIKKYTTRNIRVIQIYSHQNKVIETLK